MYLSKLETLFT